MDKLRREAERSGDSLCYALELRRQGQGLRAKRLIQDLAWDKHPGAEEALEELYPFSEDLQSILDEVTENLEEHGYWIGPMVGSMDPRVNRLLLDFLPKHLEEIGPNAQHRETYEDHLRLANRGSQLDRLKSQQWWGERMQWADPFEEEMSEFLDWHDGDHDWQERTRTQGHNLREFQLGERRLSWILIKLNYSELLRRWAKTFPARTWTEKTLVQRCDGTLRASLVPHGPAVPTWAKFHFPDFPMVRTTALWNRNFFEREFDAEFEGVPKTFL
ncbi:MAG: hypothetical protein P1V97_16290, partial [Planctomycetota bacterium]|nr:hypothetical protein [Planctomycetota bacterium]